MSTPSDIIQVSAIQFTFQKQLKMIPSVRQNKMQEPHELSASYQTFRSSSNRDLFSDPCPFCKNKPKIMQALHELKYAVQAKNQQIRELEAFIQKLSQMAFNSSQEQLFASLSPRNQEMTFAQIESSPIQPASHSTEQIVSGRSAGSAIQERQMVRGEIKRLKVQRNNQNKPSGFQMPRQSPLRAKLLEIMNALPAPVDSKVYSFESESQPQVEGLVGIVNSKVSNHKKVKRRPEINIQQSLSSTIRSQAVTAHEAEG